MEDRYYSKKLKRHFTTRLDFLLYAHDGRGLGHASRAISVGLAVKRLFPKKRVLFISGCVDTKMLIGPATLDWIKLPSYQTVLKDGVSQGKNGQAGFYKSVLGRLRREMIAAIVDILRPRCILVDHDPMGKRAELKQALKETAGKDTRWILGLRGIIGKDKEIWSQQAAETVDQYYHRILWYGDERVLGDAPVKQIDRHFKQRPLAVGYVSRLRELKAFLNPSQPQLAGTVSVPWLGEHSRLLCDHLHSILTQLGPSWGQWRFFAPESDMDALRIRFNDLAFCRVQPISEQYLSSLLHSKVAVIYGGYNSIIDVVAAEIPAVIILRRTQDNEQAAHLDRLYRHRGNTWRFFSETQVDGPTLGRAVTDLLENPHPAQKALDINGAEATATFLHTCLK
jgi:predicted glycosyltransferase